MPIISSGKRITSAAQLATDVVGADEIAANAVGASEIATDAVGADEIAANAVGSSEIATDAVGADEIATSAVGTAEINNGTIINEDISASAGIVDTKLATISTAGKVDGAAITGLANIPAGAGQIPAANLSGYALLATGQVPSAGNATFTADAGTDFCTSVAHGLLDGDGVVLTTTGGLPAGLSAGTQYYVRDKTDDTFKLAATPWGTAINITTTGTGTHTWTKKLGNITVAFTAKNHIKVVMDFVGQSGAIIGRCLFNQDGGSNYGGATQLGGAAEADDNSAKGFDITCQNAAAGGDSSVVLEFVNVAANRKKGTSKLYFPGSGATGGATAFGGFVWNNTANQVSSITIYSEQNQGWGTASRIYVFGMD